MFKQISRILPIKPGERVITALMFTYIVGTLSFLYVLKPMRSSVFLSKLPSSNLPKAYLLTAMVAGPLAALVLKFSRRISASMLVTGTNLANIGILFALRWAVAARIHFLPYALFTYVQIVFVISVSQFYLLAGYVFENRQAKRLYGLLGGGAILGSIVGSLIAQLKLSPGSMFMICVGICLFLVVLAQIVWHFRRRDSREVPGPHKWEAPSERTVDLLRGAFGSRHLRLIVLLVFLTVLAGQIADYQMDAALQETYKRLPEQEMQQSIKDFKATFNWVTNVVSLALQLTLTRFVLQRLGIHAAIQFLPISLGLASAGVVLAPSLRTATIAYGSNSVLEYSINRSGLELLFLPLSPEMRKKIKMIIDVFVDRAGKAGAAFIILLSGLGLARTGFATILVTGTCVVLGLGLRRTYVDAFRQQLARREVDLSEVGRYVTDPASLGLLVSALESTQERQILYALGLLQSARGFDFSARLLPLLKHPSALVREEAARTLIALPADFERDAECLLSDASAGVRFAAVEYLCSYDPAKSAERLRILLGHGNPDIRLAAARCAADQPSSVYAATKDLIRNLTALDGSQSVQAHEVAARLAARLPAPESVVLLREFLRDPRPGVAGAAARAAGSAGHMELVPEILPLVAQRDLRGASREALVSFGPQITPDLGVVLGDEECDPAIRRQIPWVLGRLETAGAADLLMENLNAGDFNLKYQVVKALSRIHARKPELPAKQTLVTVHVIAQTMAYYEGLALCAALGYRTDGIANGLLGKALRERLDRQLEMIFRLLGLSYPQKDIYLAYTALKEKRLQRRGSAIEFLDNILKNNLKSIILPLLEDESAERLLDRAARLFGVNVPDREEALRTLLRQPDAWLKACALHAVGADGIQELTEFCRQMVDDQNLLIRETAEWALRMVGSKKADGYLHADNS